jgi:hypothetical protein
LDYAEQRYYSSALGRFITPDPYAGSVRLGNPDTWNRYAYVNNNPTNLTDPHGLYPYQTRGGGYVDYFDEFFPPIPPEGPPDPFQLLISRPAVYTTDVVYVDPSGDRFQADLLYVNDESEDPPYDSAWLVPEGVDSAIKIMVFPTTYYAYATFPSEDYVYANFPIVWDVDAGLVGLVSPMGANSDFPYELKFGLSNPIEKLRGGAGWVMTNTIQPCGS